MKGRIILLFFLAALLVTTHGNASAFISPLEVGWAIGNDDGHTVILHTRNGGRKWVVQGKWPNPGFPGKISAVDKQTVWAAVASPGNDGVIFHSADGGATWTEQVVLEGKLIYGLKALTRLEAWAVSLDGETILHTTDGGKVWNTVDSGLDLGDVVYMNRMDAIGYRDVKDADRSGKNTGKIHANVWFVVRNGEHSGMIHTLYNGEIWRKEEIPFPDDLGVHMLSAYSPRVAWAAAWFDGTLYRTIDGGENWEAAAHAGNNDIDDMCAYSADALWLVQFQGTLVPGVIHHVRVDTDGVPDVVDFHPVDKNGGVLPYSYGGVTCIDDQTALVVGYANDPTVKQKGIVLLTNDAGQTWESQPLPVDDVKLWKVSFVGARR